MRHFSVLLVAALAACSGKQPADPASVPPGESPFAGAVTVPTAGQPVRAWPQDPVTVEEAGIVGDSLVLAVRYGGGCREHGFALILGDAWRESSPVQVDVNLAHDANGDNCRALVGKRLSFSLVPLRDAYRKAYNATSGTVIIHVRPSDRSVRYDFRQ